MRASGSRFQCRAEIAKPTLIAASDTATTRGSSPSPAARFTAAALRCSACSSLTFIFWVLWLDPAGLVVVCCARPKSASFSRGVRSRPLRKVFESCGNGPLRSAVRKARPRKAGHRGAVTGRPRREIRADEGTHLGHRNRQDRKPTSKDRRCALRRVQHLAGGRARPATWLRCSRLPPRLLEELARHFGRDMPDGREEELETFLVTKAEEFREMRERLRKLAETEDRISELVNAANAALEEGDFGTADDVLKGAEVVQLQSNTIVALEKQAKLRIERGNAALMKGDVAAATGHFERSSRYFSRRRRCARGG